MQQAKHLDFGASLRRTWALVKKESYEVVRDPSSIAIGIVMPVVLILLFGFGMSLDVKNVPIALVLEDSSREASDLAAGFQLSPYFEPRLMSSMGPAQELLQMRKVDGIIRIRSDFSRRAARGDAEVQVLVNGVDANTARIIQGYAQGAIGQWMARMGVEGKGYRSGVATLETRLWFNESNDSHYYLVPGLIVMIMTLIGAFLTAMVMAREWERGTLEALFVTPARTGEILLGKTVPYFVLGMVGFLLCIAAARFLFHVPLRGSVWVLAGAATLYLLVALGIGLLVSSATRSQFLASQIAMMVSFMPAMMLSGFLYDLHSMPTVIWLITYLMPARYFVTLLQTIFLAGDIWSVILPNAAMLALVATALLLGSRAATRKRLD